MLDGLSQKDVIRVLKKHERAITPHQEGGPIPVEESRALAGTRQSMPPVRRLPKIAHSVYDFHVSNTVLLPDIAAEKRQLARREKIMTTRPTKLMTFQELCLGLSSMVVSTSVLRLSSKNCAWVSVQ